MDPKTLKNIQAAAAGGTVSSTGWEILAYTAYPKMDMDFDNYGVWYGYSNATNNTAYRYNGLNNNNITTTWDTSRPWHRFGQMGYSPFQTHTETNSGANNRTAAGDGDGWYSAAYNKTGLTKVALVGVGGTVDLDDPTNSTNHLVYDLVGTNGYTSDSDAGTGSYSVISLLQTLSAYNRNNPSWHNTGTEPNYPNNQLFNGPNCRNFTAGGGARDQAGYSGVLSSSSGKMYPIDGDSTPYSGAAGSTIISSYPDYFCFWGINLQGDHDQQVCAAFYGNGNSFDTLGRNDKMGSLATQTNYLKNDAWRNHNVSHTFWSLWGNDCHTDTQRQNISGTGTDSQNQGFSKTLNSIAYPTAMQTFPGTAVPISSVNSNPELSMCKEVYFLGYN